MKSTAHLAQLLADLADLMELSGADAFRVRAHQRAARAVEEFQGDILKIAHEKKQLTAIDGIGDKMAEKIRQYADTGAIEEREELLREVPEGLLEVLRLPGVGPKTARALWQERGVSSIADLRRVIDDGSILGVARMGEKTVEKIRKAMNFAASSGGRVPLGVAMPLAERIVEVLQQATGARRVQFAGSLRRGRETVGDLDVLASGSDAAALREAFVGMEGVTEVLAKGESRCSVRFQAGGTLVQADLRVVPDDSFGAALLYFTGSKEHNVRLRELALKKGQTLNEYGLYPNDDDPTPPHQRGIRAVASKSEDEVFKALGVPYIPPELREERTEFMSGATPVPKLISTGDIRAELHAHTKASDGLMTIRELAERARDFGFHTIAVTDHSQSSALAGGLKADKLLAHAEAVRRANKEIEGITILAGSEVDILADGRLDYPDEVLAQLDVVVASPHAGLTQDRETATARLLRAIENPFVNIIGHPTGRLIPRREGLDLDIEVIVKAAADAGVALEINANWQRLDLRDTHVRAALDAGALIAINCDVHHPDDFDNLRYGVMTGRRGGLTPERCVNTWTPEKLHAWLRRGRG